MTELKINRVERKIQNYINKWTQRVWQRTETDRQTDCHTSLRNINRMGNEAKDDPLKDFSTVSGKGIGHED